MRTGVATFFRDLWRFFTYWLTLRPHLIVGTAEMPYMLRWWLVPRNPWLNVYLHKFVNDDEPTLHDHPWHSVSILLRGRLREVTPSTWCRWMRAQRTQWNWYGSRWFSSEEHRRGAVVYRRHEHLHRLELIDRRPAWTLFITGPMQRVWGFDCPGGWVPWTKFVSGTVMRASRGECPAP